MQDVDGDEDNENDQQSRGGSEDCNDNSKDLNAGKAAVMNYKNKRESVIYRQGSGPRRYKKIKTNFTGRQSQLPTNLNNPFHPNTHPEPNNPNLYHNPKQLYKEQNHYQYQKIITTKSLCNNDNKTKDCCSSNSQSTHTEM